MLDRGSKKNVFSYFVILSNSSKDGQLFKCIWFPAERSR